MVLLESEAEEDVLVRLLMLKIVVLGEMWEGICRSRM